jgi:hypothetical protein
MQTALPDIDGNVSQDSFLAFIDEYDVADQAVAEAVGARKDLRKRIRGAGFHLGAFDHTRKEAQKDIDRRNEEDREFRRNMAWLGKPLGFQADWVGAPTEPGPGESGNGANDDAISEHQVHQVELAGLTAGRNGHDRGSNPWGVDPQGVGTFLYQRWDEKWLDGQEEIARRMGPQDPPVRRPRGRPQGSKNRPKDSAAAPE